MNGQRNEYKCSQHSRSDGQNNLFLASDIMKTYNKNMRDAFTKMSTIANVMLVLYKHSTNKTLKLNDLQFRHNYETLLQILCFIKNVLLKQNYVRNKGKDRNM